jgi:hypothetical protein
MRNISSRETQHRLREHNTPRNEVRKTVAFIGTWKKARAALLLQKEKRANAKTPSDKGLCIPKDLNDSCRIFMKEYSHALTADTLAWKAHIGCIRYLVQKTMARDAYLGRRTRPSLLPEQGNSKNMRARNIVRDKSDVKESAGACYPTGDRKEHARLLHTVPRDEKERARPLHTWG